jgi:phage repressor protein C with HTH and peptisase S24 domain
LLCTLREQSGMTQQALADAIGCSKAQLSLMESGQRSITMDRAKAVEHALKLADRPITSALQWANVPPRVQLELEQSRANSTALANKLRRAIQSADPVSALRRVIGSAANQSGAAASGHDNVADFLPLNAVRGIPLINRVAAGYPTEFTDLDYPARIADEYVSCPDVTDPDAFAARVVGDSMQPDYREGDIVVFSPAMPTVSGSDCFVRLERDDQTTFKRVYFEEEGQMIRLQPLNGAYPPKVVHREDVAGMYAAAYVMRKVRGDSAS